MPKRTPVRARPKRTPKAETGWPKTVETLTGEIKVFHSRKAWSADARRRYQEQTS